MIEEYGNGRTKVNGIEQPQANHNKTLENKVRLRSEIVMNNIDRCEKLQIEQDDVQEINKANREKDELRQRMIQEVEMRREQERLRGQWERQRRQDLLMQHQQEQERYFELQQQQLMFYQEGLRQQDYYNNNATNALNYYQYNPYFDDDDDSNFYYPASPHPPSFTSHYYHLY